MTVVGATLIAAFFILFALYIRADLEELGREHEAADHVGADEASSNGIGDRVGDAGADTYEREWVLARSKPYDQDAA